LLTGEFKCSLKDCDYYDLIMKIKKLTVEEIQPFIPEVAAAMSDLNMMLSVAESKSKYLDMKPDLEQLHVLGGNSYHQPLHLNYALEPL